MQELPLTGFYSGESKKLSDRRCINFIPRVSDSGALSQFSLMPTCGRDSGKSIDPTFNPLALTNIDVSNKVKSNSVEWTLSNRPSCIYVKDQAVVAVSNTITEGRLLKYDADTVQPNNERVRIANSSNTLVIIGYGRIDWATSSNNYYIQYATGNAFNFQLHDSALSNRPIVDVAFFGGRFLYCNYDTSNPRVYYSELTSPVASNLDFISPDGNNGLLKGIEVHSNTLYVFGETKTYLYQVTANTDIPYQLVGSVDVGLYQPESKVRTPNGIYFIGKTDSNNYGVYRLSGGGVQKISSDQIDYQINLNGVYDTFGPTSNGDALKWPDYIPVFRMSDDNQDLIVFNMPNICLVYSESTGVWHERKTQGRDNWDCVGYGLTPEGPLFISDTWTDNGDGSFNTNISEKNIDSGYELGQLVERKMISSPYNANNDRMIVSELEPVCEVDYSEPVSGWSESKINLSVSYDFGNSFEQERSSNVGGAGNYKQRTRFFNIGYVEQAFTVMLRVMSPYPTRILKLLARTSKGGS